MKPDIEELRKKYIENPPEGMTTTLLTICLEKKVFISSKSNHRPIVMPIPLLI